MAKIRPLKSILMLCEKDRKNLQARICLRAAYPGPPSAPKVASAFKDCITLSWSPPADTGGTNVLGYNLEKRKKGSSLWGQVNPPEEMIRSEFYWLHVINAKYENGI